MQSCYSKGTAQPKLSQFFLINITKLRHLTSVLLLFFLFFSFYLMTTQYTFTQNANSYTKLLAKFPSDNLLTKSYIHVSHSLTADINGCNTITKSLSTMAVISVYNWCQTLLNTYQLMLSAASGVEATWIRSVFQRVSLRSPSHFFISYSYYKGTNSFFNTKLSMVSICGSNKGQIQDKSGNVLSQYLLHASPWDKVATL